MRSAVRIGLGFACLGLVAAAAPANLYLHNTLDLSNSNFFTNPLFNNESPYGTNPSAIATDGSSLFLAGFNGGTSVNQVAGVVKILDPWGTPSAVQVTSIAGTPGARGFSGLTYDPAVNAVYSAYDNGAASPNGLAGWDATSGAQLWAKNVRGGSGVGVDPGFGGEGNGAAWTTFGSGRRALQNGATGADIYTTSDGMIISLGGVGTFWRDMDFAPNGDIWLRSGNKVLSAPRTGANAVGDRVLVADETTADFVNGQNIGYLAGMPGGDLVIYNARPNAGLGQLWSDVVKLINPDGTPAAAQLLDGLGDALGLGFANGNGYYDFAWDAENETLLVLDFTNRQVYQFKTIPVPEPAALLLFAVVAGLARRR